MSVHAPTCSLSRRSAVVTLRDVHVVWAWVVIVSNGLAGLWALAAHWVARMRLRSLWWFVIASELTIFVQVVMGVWMVTGEKLHVSDFHMFYGFVALISVGLLYAYRVQLRAWLYLLYGLGGLFLMGLGLRAVVVGL
jgi:hypothetical protein